MKMFKMTAVLVVAVFLGTALIAESEITKWIKVNPNGTAEIDKILVEVQHFGEGYAFMSQSSAIQDTGTIESGTFSLSTKFRTATGGNFNFTENISKSSDNSISISILMSSNEGIKTEELSLVFILPVESFSAKTISLTEGKSITLPAVYEKSFLGYFQGTNKIEIPMPNGKILEITPNEQTLDFLVQDNRKWNNNVYVVRVNFKPAKGNPLLSSRAELKIKIR